MKKFLSVSAIASTAILGTVLLTGCGSSSSSSGGGAGGGKNAPFLMLTDANATATNGTTVINSTNAMNTVLSNSQVSFSTAINADWNVTIPGTMVVDVDKSGDYNASEDKFISDFGFSQLTGVGGGEINVLTTLAMAKLAAATTPAAIADANALLTAAKAYDVTKTVKKSDLSSSNVQTQAVAKTNEMLKSLLENTINTVKLKGTANILSDLTVPASVLTTVKQVNDGNYSDANASVAAAQTDANNTATITSGVLTAAEQTIVQNNVNNTLNNLAILQDLEAAGDMTEAELEKAAIQLTDTSKNITQVLAVINSDRNSSGGTDINTSSVTAAITAAETAAAAALAAAEAAEAARPVAAKLTTGQITLGGETVLLDVDYKGFTHSLDVTNSSTVSDFYNISIPVNEAAVDKNKTITDAALFIKIAEETNTSKFASLVISGATLNFTTDDNRSARDFTMNFTSDTNVTVASSLTGLISEMGATSVVANLASDMTLEDFAFDLDTLLSNLNTNSTQVNNAITALNSYLVQTNSYLVDIGVDGNVTTDFSEHNITIGGMTYTTQGLQGNVNVNNPNYNKAPSALTCSSESTIVVNEGEVMTAVDLSACFSDTETLTYTHTTLPTGLTLSTAGSLSGTPTTPASGTSVTVTATDSANQTATKDITISVVDNPTPTLGQSIGTLQFAVDTNNTSDLSMYFGDDDNTTLTFAVSGCTLPSTMSFDSNGTLTATMPQEGNTTGCTVTATDKIGQTVSDDFNISVVTDPLAGMSVIASTDSKLALNANAGTEGTDFNIYELNLPSSGTQNQAPLSAIKFTASTDPEVVSSVPISVPAGEIYVTPTYKLTSGVKVGVLFSDGTKKVYTTTTNW